MEEITDVSLPCGKAGVAEIHPKMLKALDIVGLYFLTLQCHMEVSYSTCGVADLGGGSHFQKGGTDGVLQSPGYHIAQPPLKRV